MDPQDVIGKLLREREGIGAPEQTPNEIVDWRFMQPTVWPDYLPNSPYSENIIDRRYSTDDPAASPQDYIDRAFQELMDPGVR